jgi:hypothetical protein
VRRLSGHGFTSSACASPRRRWPKIKGHASRRERRIAVVPKAGDPSESAGECLRKSSSLDERVDGRRVVRHVPPGARREVGRPFEAVLPADLEPALHHPCLLGIWVSASIGRIARVLAQLPYGCAESEEVAPDQRGVHRAGSSAESPRAGSGAMPLRRSSQAGGAWSQEHDSMRPSTTSTSRGPVHRRGRASQDRSAPDSPQSHGSHAHIHPEWQTTIERKSLFRRAPGDTPRA